MNSDQKRLIEFIMRLPSRLEVEVHRTAEGKFWAKVLNLPGCVTQADSFGELIEMINDAVHTYFEIPEKISQHLGIYIPEKVKKVMEQREQQKQLEDVVREIMAGDTERLSFSLGGTA